MEELRLGQNPMLETQKLANESVDKQKRYMQIKEILKDKKMTAKEIAVEMANKGYVPFSERNFTSPRLTEMCQKGEVEPAGKKKCEYTGKLVTVFKLREVN